MTDPLQINAFLAAIEGIDFSQDNQTLAVKSKDYYWYSPILAKTLSDKLGEVVVKPKTRAEVVRVAAAACRQQIHLTVRGGGTGNYGQCVPLVGGIVLDLTGLNRVLSIEPGRVTCEAGAVMMDVERAVRANPCVQGGQELLMYPSTRDIATVGGFVGGGYGGAGSIRNGILKDPGNVTSIKVVTLEAQPRVIELVNTDIQKVHHAFGTNGIMVELTLSLKPAVDWIHHIALFDGYSEALSLCVSATEAVKQTVAIGANDSANAKLLDAFLITAVERRFAPFYEKEFGERFPHNRDAVFSMIHPDYMDRWRAMVAEHGGVETLAMTEQELSMAAIPPAFECGWNHTTLMALRQDSSWTNLQTIHSWPLDIGQIEEQMQRWGDEVLMHHEFARDHDGAVVFGLPLVAYFDKDRLYEIINEFEADGCVVLDNHVYTIEGGGMKTIDSAQIDFKKVADPHGLMNPGKTEGWRDEMRVPFERL
ncbi:MAG: FAD-binding oxidoreductase [Burkholderiales bacterium]|nr:MAG: FAD-binding oxidoreductase [Burkholderiales bacterium]